MRSVIAGLAGLLLLASAASAGIVHDEAVSGDFSNDGLAPTAVSVAAGSNQVLGTTGAATAPDSKDYFTITVPAGLRLANLRVLAGTAAAPGTPGGNAIFMGLQAGDQVTATGAGGSAAGLLGWALFGAAAVGTDLLPVMGASGLGATGFSGALPAGDYAFWIQDTSGGTAVYGLDLNIVPAPAGMLMMLSGLAGLAAVRRRR